MLFKTSWCEQYSKRFFFKSLKNRSAALVLKQAEQEKGALWEE